MAAGNEWIQSTEFFEYITQDMEFYKKKSVALNISDSQQNDFLSGYLPFKSLEIHLRIFGLQFRIADV